MQYQANYEQFDEVDANGNRNLKSSFNYTSDQILQSRATLANLGLSELNIHNPMESIRQKIRDDEEAARRQREME